MSALFAFVPSNQEGVYPAILVVRHWLNAVFHISEVTICFWQAARLVCIREREFENVLKVMAILRSPPTMEMIRRADAGTEEEFALTDD